MIYFKDLILDTVLRGLKTLKVLNDFKLVVEKNRLINDVDTIIKSNIFHESLI